MNITEAAPLTALQQGGPWLRHVHLADNNRRLPGQGHIDFTAALRTLQNARYDGWYSFECAVEGDFVAALGSCMRAALPQRRCCASCLDPSSNH
jgi:sugar phosphate isomerase/epimerase